MWLLALLARRDRPSPPGLRTPILKDETLLGFAVGKVPDDISAHGDPHSIEISELLVNPR